MFRHNRNKRFVSDSAETSFGSSFCSSFSSSSSCFQSKLVSKDSQSQVHYWQHDLCWKAWQIQLPGELEYLFFIANSMVYAGEHGTSTFLSNILRRNNPFSICKHSLIYTTCAHYHVGRLRWTSDLLQSRRRGLPGRYCQLGQGLCRDLQVLPMPQSTYIYRVQSSVWRLPNYWPPASLPLHPASVSSPSNKGRGVHTRREGRVRGWVVNISEDARHWIGLLQYIPSKAYTIQYIDYKMNFRGNFVLI